MFSRVLLVLAIFGLASPLYAASPAGFPEQSQPTRPVKVMIITMFTPEGAIWLQHLGPWRAIQVAGLSPDFPEIHCNDQDICVMTTGMGYANAAASIMAMAFSPQFDLRKTYFLVAGIAGIDPKKGTIGSAAWADYLEDFGNQWELDSRESAPDWPTGFLGIETQNPTQKPKLAYHTEVFELNHSLVDAAYAVSHQVVLDDSDAAKVARAKFNYAPANKAPAVTRCDTLSSQVWWSGTLIGEQARQWTKLLTDGKGAYCTTQQEDNATYAALQRAANAHRLDLRRVAVLRAGSDFDRPYDGQSSLDNLLNYAQQGGFKPAIENLYRAGNPFVQEIVTNWAQWQSGVPDVMSSARSHQP